MMKQSTWVIFGLLLLCQVLFTFASHHYGDGDDDGYGGHDRDGGYGDDGGHGYGGDDVGYGYGGGHGGYGYGRDD
ncbi:uncharacterized protein [Palaemon carinicauda]|uniref:uncharacterized protein n=1 Tax=Palaemon carinicauda TaxID=392227 RepID=UPI0035B65221